MCKAEANVSSNLPESLPAAVSQYEKTVEVESPPAELSTYEKIVELLTTLFPVWVCCTKIYEVFVFLLPTNVQLYIVDMVQMFVNLLIQRSPVTGYTRHYYWHLQAIYGNLSPIFICHYCLE